MRLYEYAKKIGVSSKDVLDLLRNEKVEVKSHFVEATWDMISLINKKFGSRTADKVDLPVDTSAQRREAKKKRVEAPAPTPERKSATAAAPEAQRKPSQPQSPHRPKMITVPKSQSPILRRPAPPAPGTTGAPGSGEEGGTEEAYQPLVNHQAHRHKRANFKHQQAISAAPEAEEVVSSSLLGAAMGPDAGRRGGRRSKRKRPTNAQIAERAVKTIAQMPSSGAPRRKVEATPEGVVEVETPVTLRDLSAALGVKLDRIMKVLMAQGTMARLNDVLSDELLQVVALEFGKEIRFIRPKDLEDELHEELAEVNDRKETAVHRPPVVAFLGHVDHGKTSLLDRIRKTRVVDTESGGITQHIGAYQVELDSGKITFIDTPGHEAFSTMRARGASLTDIVVLVVAADDGPMPQTKEAYSHAKAAGVPIIVALNKIDLPNANPERAMQALAGVDESLLAEEWGGKCGIMRVSAQTGEGIDALLERIILESEMLELRASPEAPAQGNVLEARITENHGIVVSALVTNGTLRRGDVVLSSAAYGKIKLLYDAAGNTLEEAGPSTPVQFTGLSEVPEAGDRFYILDDISKARSIAEKRAVDVRHERLVTRQHVNLGNLQEYLASAEVKELRVILKADMTGTLEVLRKTLNDLSTGEVKINIIHEGVGGISHADVILADASDAIIIGFHVSIDSIAKTQAEAERVQYKIYHIIYRMVEDMKAALSGLLPPEERENITGHITIRQVFKISRVGTIGGAFVSDGKVMRSHRIRLFRDNVMIYEGRIGNLQRFKDQVREVNEGYECGVQLDGYNDIREGDVIEAYEIQEIARTLE